MSESPQYEAFRAFARAEIRAEKLALKAELAKELKAELQESFTRSAPQVIEGQPGPAGKDGAPGKDGVDGKDGNPGERGEKGDTGERGADGIQGIEGRAGKDGAPGEKGERGADGIATREEITSLIEERFADIQVRSLADVWRGVWKAGETYKPGELAQWDGSPWIALRASKDVKPGTSGPDWNLFAKKGRDGR